MTFNVRFDDGDEARGWGKRRTDVLDVVRSNDPDLISLQEPDASQWADICEHLVGYAPFGVFDDGTANPEAHGGLFRAERFERCDDGVFWLSHTPAVPHSVSWDTDWEPRACGWARLRDRATGRELVFASTHFDTNTVAGLPSATTLHHEIERLARGAPTVIAGDFNCAAGSEAHRYLIDPGGFRDIWYEAGHSDAGVLTFHGFTGHRHRSEDPARPERSLHHNDRIDWILVRGEFTCLDAKIDYSSKSGAPASDHYPVVGLLDY
jgi:endonuclease/exonuclease/phosphatase family metal-dependent hydrolase